MGRDNQARNHHWVPQCYLKGFAKSRSKNAKLFVIDTIERKTFPTIPRNVASERDFNKIEVAGVDPNHIESGYAHFEGRVDKALERLCASRQFGDAEDRNLILNLIALLAVRNPLMRENSRQFQERVLKQMMQLMVAKEEHYEARLQRAKRDGDVSADAELSYEAMRDFVERDRYTIEVPTTRHVEQELKLVDTVLPLLGARKWQLLRAPTNAGGFVTSDHPVVLLWSEPKDRGPFHSPGFGLRGTEVIFSVSSELAMVGTFEGQDDVVDVEPGIVALVNGIIIAHSNRQIYARDDRFWYVQDPVPTPPVVQRGADLLQYGTSSVQAR
jgi:hypothetical protein